MSRKTTIRRKEERRRKWLAAAASLTRRTLVAAFFVIAAGAVVAGLFAMLDQPLGAVEVEGPFQRVLAVDAERVLQPFVGEGFLSTRLAEVRAAVEALAWVDRARVKREWPNGLYVIVTEHVAAARWGDEGLLNTRGELFISNAERLPPELPQLNGPDGSEWRVAQRYLEVRGPLIEAGYTLSGVTLDNRGSWRLMLDSALEVRLGRDHTDKRLTQFIEVAAPLIHARRNEVGYVDMRYTNGFAIGWRDREELAMRRAGL